MTVRLLHGRILLCAGLVTSPPATGTPGPLAAGRGEAVSAFPVLEGWTAAGDRLAFGPANLFEHIDGAAEAYLSYRFRNLQVQEYTNSGGASVVVEIYRHESAAQAFGIYSQERPEQGDFLRIGAEGYLEPPALNFVRGDSYVKISVYPLDDRTAAALRTFADATAAALGGESELPPELHIFPEEGKKPHSERFVEKDFLGYEFLRSAFTADYDTGGFAFRLFVIHADSPAECEAMLRRHLESAGRPMTNLQQGGYVISDKNLGEIGVVWTGRYLCGALRLQDRAVRARYLRALTEAIEASARS
jgi:hypothetical protein